MTLYHYSAKPFTLDRTRPYEQKAQDFKPRGLWLSVEDDWQRWCEGEEFALPSLAHRTRVDLMLGANILAINKAVALDEFTSVYTSQSRIRIGINWRRVAERYDGIVIAPYIDERRLTPYTTWYYGWDCASGCVWNARVLNVTADAD